jgi:hypothetical protein
MGWDLPDLPALTRCDGALQMPVCDSDPADGQSVSLPIDADPTVIQLITKSALGWAIWLWLCFAKSFGCRASKIVP